jgi:pimeloyl-ACP methyl ester carboxylesterase
LTAAGVAGPFVVVGHSYGGLVVRAFADAYPDEVVGMVLVDASHPDQWQATGLPGGSRLAAEGNWVPAILANFGILRLTGMHRVLSAGLPERQAAELAASLARPGPWSTSAGVLAVWDARSRPVVSAAGDLGDLPLAVVSAPERPGGATATGYAQLLDAQQAALAALSAHSEHVIVDGATHENLITDAGHARVVAGVIQDIVASAATKSGG